MAKAPLRNPFGFEEEPANFNDFDIFTKVSKQTKFTSKLMADIVTLDPDLTAAHAVDDGKSRPHPRENGGTKGY